MTKEPQPRIINRWYVLILVGGISLLLFLGGYFFYLSEVRAFREDKHREIQAIADLKISQITQWRKDKIAETMFFAQSAHLTRAIEAWLSNQTNPSLKKEIVESFKFFGEQGKFGYSNVYLSSTLGDCFFSIYPQEDTLSAVTSSAIKEATKSGQITFTDFYYCPIHHTIHFDIIAPVSDQTNRLIAALIFRIDPDDFLYPLIQTWPTPSKTSESLIVKKDGDSVLFLNELRHVKNTAMLLRESLSKKEVPAVKAVLGYSGIYEGKDYRGVDVLAYIEPVPGTPWYMVTKVDKSEIYGELKFRAVFIGAFTVVLILLIVVSLSLIYRSRQKNIYLRLLETDEELRTSHEEYKTTLYSIGDGVITTDISGHIKYMNPVAEQLTGWNEIEAAGKPLQKVFRIINEDSRLDVTNPVEKVLREGLVVRLENHTLLVSKNGMEIPIADSGAPIRSHTGEMTGVVLVFRDQTREREAARVLLYNEAKFRNLFDQSPVGKSITGMDGSIKVNKAFCDMLGYSPEELMSKKWQEITHPDDIQSSADIIQTLLDGKRSSTRMEKRYLHKNGSVVWADVSTYLQRDEQGAPQYFITAVNNITQRRQLEQEAKEALAKTDQLLQGAEKSRRALLSVLEDEKNARFELKKLNEELEQKIIERTKDLSDINSELKRMNKLFVDREQRMVELKQRIKELESIERGLNGFSNTDKHG